MSPSPRKSPKPNEQPYPAAEIDLVVNTNPHGKSIGNVKEVQIVTSSPLGIKSRTSAAARLMSTDPTLCSMFAHRLFMGATIPNNSVESEVDQEIHSPPSSTLLFNSLEKKREVGKAVLADTGTVIEDPMYTVIEYSKNIEPRDRTRWARVLNRTISPTSPSSSSSSSSCTISSSSATQLSFLASSADVAVPPNLVYHPSYLRIKVTGGWMKTKGKGRQVDGSVPAGSAGSYDTDMPNDTDVEIGMTVEQRVRQKAASVCNQRQIPLHPQNEESFSLCGRYKRKLLEAVAASAYSAAHKRKTSSGDVKTTVGYYNHPLSNPLLFYLPSDGGLTAACVSCAPVPISLQTLCASGEMCAYCLHRFQPNMRLYSPAQMSHMAKKRREKERRAAAIRKKVPSREGGEGDHAEEDSSESVLHLVSKKVGSVLYTIHRQCAFAIDSGWLFTSHSSSHARLSARYSVDQGPISSSSAAGSGSGSSCDVEEGVVVNNSVTAFKGIDLGDLYECDEGDDAECDLCGRAGGIMQFFDLHAQYSSQLPPGEEGWLGHIPCVSWLIKSRLLELPPSSICYSRSRPYMHATGDASSVIVPDNEIDVIDSGTKSLSSFSTSGNGSIEAASLDLSAQHESPSVNNNTPVPAIGEKWMSYVSIPTIPSSTTTRTSPTLKRDFNDFCSPHAHASRERTHTAIEDMATSLRDDLPSKTLTAVDGTATATPSTEFVALTIPPSTAVSSINSIMCDKQDNQHGSNRDLLGDPGSTWNVEDAQTRMDIDPDVQKEVEKEIDAVLEPSLEDGKEDVDVPVGEQESLNDLSKIQPSDSALDQSKKERQPLSSSMTQQPSPSPSPHHKHVPEKARRKGEILRPLSLFDSLVGQWRCSLCGTYAGVVLRCTAVACTVRAHPLCVSVAGKGWSDFSVARYCSTSPESATINGDQCNRTRGGQKIGETDCVLGFLCALHSVESKQ